MRSFLGRARWGLHFPARAWSATGCCILVSIRRYGLLGVRRLGGEAASDGPRQCGRKPAEVHQHRSDRARIAGVDDAAELVNMDIVWHGCRGAWLAGLHVPGPAGETSGEVLPRRGRVVLRPGGWSRLRRFGEVNIFVLAQAVLCRPRARGLLGRHGARIDGANERGRDRQRGQRVGNGSKRRGKGMFTNSSLPWRCACCAGDEVGGARPVSGWLARDAGAGSRDKASERRSINTNPKRAARQYPAGDWTGGQMTVEGPRPWARWRLSASNTAPAAVCSRPMADRLAAGFAAPQMHFAGAGRAGLEGSQMPWSFLMRAGASRYKIQASPSSSVEIAERTLHIADCREAGVDDAGVADGQSPLSRRLRRPLSQQQPVQRCAVEHSAYRSSRR